MKTIHDYLGHWPQDLDEARAQKRLLHIPPEKALTVIHGKEHQTKQFIRHNGSPYFEFNKME